MQLFYTQDIKGDTAFLDEEETRHCSKVLRHKIGDTIHFIDGKGGLYQAEIQQLGKKDIQLRIMQKQEQQKWPGYLHLAIAPTKNISRTEWFVEKCTELGVDEISFFLGDHSERSRIRMDRMEKVALAAAKQSLKAFVPVLNPMSSTKEIIGGVKENYNKNICFVKNGNPHLARLPHAYKQSLILIGPEGDFSEREIRLALDAGFIATGLGDSRLRTETAGFTACHIFHLAMAGLLA